MCGRTTGTQRLGATQAGYTKSHWDEFREGPSMFLSSTRAPCADF